MSGIYERLKAYGESDYYGFHMPGHKRNDGITGALLPYRLDITEIDGFDDLHHPSGILRDAQDEAARLYHAGETHFLVNGSTVGILSAVAAVTRKGDTVLVARNCHKSVYHAIYMNELKPVYLYPGFCADLGLNGEIDPGDVKNMLSIHPDIRAVVIVSPTYDGVVSDIAAVAKIVHEAGVPLIVDEAHGAHFGFHPYFPDNSNQKGADIVIHSLHKTLPSLTQTALLHMNGGLVDRKRVRNFLHMLQTSSPSYILMAGIDVCLNQIRAEGSGAFDNYVNLLKDARMALGQMRRLKLAETSRFDRSKIVISVRDAGISGRQLSRLLRDSFHLQMEMAAGSYILAMTGPGDTREGMRRLVEALSGIDRGLPDELDVKARPPVDGDAFPELEMVHSSYVCEQMADQRGGGTSKAKSLLWSESPGYVSLEYAYLYPPGCPLVVPGEKISKKAADMLQWYQDMGFVLEGPSVEGHIEVLSDG